MTKIMEHDAQPQKLMKFFDVETTRSDLSHISGCQCKLSGNDLREILADTYGSDYTSRPEDCAVVVAGDDVTLLLTNDLGPLVGINQFLAGRIAALHALSDIFASGGQPTHALVTLIIKKEHPLSFGKAVMSGIIATCREEGVKIVGGQTILGGEAMAGLSVVGVPGKRILRKTGARPGQKLLVSKPLGVGLVVRGFKLGLLSRGSLDEAVEIMCASNRRASAALLDAGVAFATDVTGFGLLGHLSEMLGENFGAKIKLKTIPYIESVRLLPNGVGNTSYIRGNLEYAQTRHNIINNNFENLDLLLDPQTNGGLLAAADDSNVEKLNVNGFALIGEITNGNNIIIE